MAIQNEQGLYLKVEGIDFCAGTILCSAYINYEYRQTNPELNISILTNDMIVLGSTMQVIPITSDINWEVTPPENTNVRDAIKAYIYLILKQIEPYTTWSDC